MKGDYIMNIKDFKLLTQNPKTFSVAEFEVELSDLPESIIPYLKEDICINASFKSKCGKEIKTDAFYFEEYAFSNDLELLGRTEKAPSFRFRICPNSVGIWNYKITLSFKGEIKDILDGSLEIADNKNGSKLLKIEPRRRRVFATADGTPVFLIGENYFWTKPETDIKLYAQYIINAMKKLAANGVNHIRFVDNIESGVSVREKLHYMRQDSSAMLDEIFKTAEELGMYITYALLHTSDTNGYANPEKIWNTANGGYIDDAKEFFTDERTKKAVKDYYRYFLSRWGYSEYITNWEMMNEIDRNELAYVGGGNFQKQKDWLSEMHDFLAENDPYGHLISASSFFINIWPHLRESFDFVHLHQCDPCGIGMWFAIQSDCNRAYGLPVLISNSGLTGARANISGGMLTEDLLVFHQANWSGLMGGGAGTCMNQAWKELSEFDGEKYFKPIADMAKLIPWNDPEMRTVTAESAPVSNGRIDVMGYNADNNYYLWLYDNRHYSTCRHNVMDFSKETITLTLKSGKYEVNWIDILTGESVKREEIMALDGKTAVSMPTWSKYIALTVMAK